MLLMSLKLQNFRQHANTFIRFERGLTGIIGTNGAGKSTVLEGIAFALYGTSAARGNKDSIKWRRASSKMQVRVELEFELAGHRYRVVRGLSMAECYLDGAEAPIANSLSGVSELLLRTLGMTRAEFFRTYFTGQKDLASLAALSAPERAKFMSRALGYDKVATAQELVREKKKIIAAQIATLRTTIPDYDSVTFALTSARQRLADANTNAATALQRRNVATDALTLVKPRWQSVQETRDNDARILNELRLVESQIESLTRDRDRLAVECDGLLVARTEHDRLTPLLVSLPLLRTELAELDRIAAADVAQQQARGRLASLDEQLAQNNQRMELVYSAQDALESAAERQLAAAVAYESAVVTANLAANTWADLKANAKSELERLRQLHATLTTRRTEMLAKGANGACNACGKPLGADWESALAQIDAELADVADVGKEKKLQVTKLDATPSDVSAAETAKTAAQSALRAADAQVTEAQSKLTERDRLVVDRRRLQDQRDAEQAKLDATAAPYDASRHVAVRAEIDQLTTTDRRVAVLASQLQREQAAHSEHSAVSSSLAQAQARATAFVSERASIGFSEATFSAVRSEFEALTLETQTATTAAMGAENEVRSATDAVGFAETQVERTAAAREQLNTLELDRKRHDDLDRAYTDLRAELNARLRPELAAIASALLEILTDGRYSEADFDENYVLTLMKDGEPQPVISGGEEDLCNLVLRLAISQMIAARAGHAFSLLVLDEVFGSMDETRRNNVVDLLRALNDRFEQVIVITHIGQVRDGLDHIVQIGYDEDQDCSIVTDGAAATVALIEEDLKVAA